MGVSRDDVELHPTMNVSRGEVRWLKPGDGGKLSVGKIGLSRTCPTKRQDGGLSGASEAPKLLICLVPHITLLTIYDMCKAVDRGMTITDVGLVEKHGGKSGRWVAGG